MLGLPELTKDPRSLVNEDRYRNQEALWKELEAAFLQRPPTEWLERLPAVVDRGGPP